MTELEKMQREKMCIDKPANVVAPQTDAEIANNRTRNNVCIGRCHHIPKEGNFKVGAEYEYSYIIDGIYVIDDNGDSIDFNDYTFLWYFTKL